MVSRPATRDAPGSRHGARVPIRVLTSRQAKEKRRKAAAAKRHGGGGVDDAGEPLPLTSAAAPAAPLGDATEAPAAEENEGAPLEPEAVRWRFISADRCVPKRATSPKANFRATAPAHAPKEWRGYPPPSATFPPPAQQTPNAAFAPRPPSQPPARSGRWAGATLPLPDDLGALTVGAPFTTHGRTMLSNLESAEVDAPAAPALPEHDGPAAAVAPKLFNVPGRPDQAARAPCYSRMIQQDSKGRSTLNNAATHPLPRIVAVVESVAAAPAPAPPGPPMHALGYGETADVVKRPDTPPQADGPAAQPPLLPRLAAVIDDVPASPARERGRDPHFNQWRPPSPGAAAAAAGLPAPTVSRAEARAGARRGSMMRPQPTAEPEATPFGVFVHSQGRSPRPGQGRRGSRMQQPSPRAGGKKRWSKRWSVAGVEGPDGAPVGVRAPAPAVTPSHSRRGSAVSAAGGESPSRRPVFVDATPPPPKVKMAPKIVGLGALVKAAGADIGLSAKAAAKAPVGEDAAEDPTQALPLPIEYRQRAAKPYDKIEANNAAGGWFFNLPLEELKESAACSRIDRGGRRPRATAKVGLWFREEGGGRCDGLEAVTLEKHFLVGVDEFVLDDKTYQLSLEHGTASVFNPPTHLYDVRRELTDVGPDDVRAGDDLVALVNSAAAEYTAAIAPGALPWKTPAAAPASPRADIHTHITHTTRRSSGFRGIHTAAARKAVPAAVVAVVYLALQEAVEEAGAEMDETGKTVRFDLGAAPRLSQSHGIRQVARAQAIVKAFRAVPDGADPRETGLQSGIRHLHYDLQAHWRKLTGDADARLDDVDPHDILTGLSGAHPRRHPLSNISVAASCPEELRNMTSIIHAPGGQAFAVSVLHGDMDDPCAPAGAAPPPRRARPAEPSCRDRRNNYGKWYIAPNKWRAAPPPRQPAEGEREAKPRKWVIQDLVDAAAETHREQENEEKWPYAARRRTSVASTSSAGSDSEPDFSFEAPRTYTISQERLEHLTAMQREAEEKLRLRGLLKAQAKQLPIIAGVGRVNMSRP